MNSLYLFGCNNNHKELEKLYKYRIHRKQSYYGYLLMLLTDEINLQIAVMIDFQILGLIGEGSFSQVFKVRRKIDNRVYALKKMSLMHLNASQRSNCLNQIYLLSKIKHPNIIQYKEAFYEDNHLCLITQLAQHGDFLQFMIKRRKEKSKFLQEQICVYARQMANGLAALHKTKIIHRDVKAANFFLTHNKTIKLGDMNVSAISRNGMACTKIGTPYYKSPQIWLQKPYSTAADIWSFGCLLYEMITFTHPFSGKDLFELKSSVLKGIYRPISECSPQLKVIIQKCIEIDPSRRITASDLINNEYLKRKYNEYKQNTMEKDPLKLKERHITCVRILKEISQQGNHSLVKTNLPPKNYTNISPEKRGNSNGSVNTKKKRPLSQKMKTIMNIYNLKPGLNQRGGYTNRIINIR